MRYITKYSVRGMVNRLAERISQKLGDNNKYDVAIEVTYHESFYVVKGYTNNPTVLNLTEYKEEFLKTEKDFMEKVGVNKKINIIDIINYKDSIEYERIPFWFEFWNSKRPLYNSSLIQVVESESEFVSNVESVKYTNKLEYENIFPLRFHSNDKFGNVSSLSVSSEFPYGYSLSAGKTKLYYSEYICNQLFTVLNTDRILFKMCDDVLENNDYDIEIISNSQYSDRDVKSMVLDIFDFNFTKFETDYLRKYDFVNELENPFETKQWINKDRVRELMFV